MMRTPRAHAKAHLDWVRGLPCCICGNNIQTEAAHIRMSCEWAGKGETGLGRRPSDHFTVPLCSDCHRGPKGQHSMNEREWWTQRGKDPVCIALALWAATGNQEIGERIALCDWTLIAD